MIILLIDSSGVGGAERHIATLARSLMNQGIPATVVLYGHHGTNRWLEQLRDDALAFRVLDNTPGGLWRELAKTRPNLLHTHGYKAGILGRLMASLLGIPVVSTFHSGERSAFPVAAYELLDEWSSFLSSNIAVSEFVARRLPFGAEIIPSFVLAGDPPALVDLPRRIGFVGRFSPEKRPDMFCEIARQVGDGIEWHMYGDGPLRPALECAYTGLVQFHGVVTDMSAVWPTLGALLMPSSFEGLPLAALEALSEGVPVIASDVGGLPTVVDPGRTGWLFPAGDVAAAVDRVSKWLSQPQDRRMAMRQACWEHVAGVFSEKRHLPSILDVYRRAGFRNPALSTA